MHDFPSSSRGLTLASPHFEPPEGNSDTNCNWCARSGPQKLVKRTERLRNQRTNGDYPDYSIIQIGQNTKKSPGDLRRVAVTQPPMKNHQLMLVRKTLKGVIIIKKWKFKKEIIPFLVGPRIFQHSFIKIKKRIENEFLSIFLRWDIMYVIYIFRTIVLIFVAMFITTFRPLYAPAFFGWLECRT